MRRVVITGLGCVSPAGIGVQSLWEAIKHCKNFEKTIPALDYLDAQSKIFCPVESFKETTIKEKQYHDRHAQLAFEASKEAIESSGIINKSLNHSRVGVNISTAIAGTGKMAEYFMYATDQGKVPVPIDFVVDHLYEYMCPSTISYEVANLFKFSGPCLPTSTGCSSGQDAIGFAFNMIKSDLADAFIVGATDAPLLPISIAAFDVIGAITKKDKKYVGKASCPFSKERDGFVLSEGAGIIVMESYEHAMSRGANILAELASFTSTCNAYHMTSIPADGEDLARAIKKSIEDAQISYKDIDYINAHGSSTIQNDRSETSAFNKVFRETAKEIPISSIKSNFGHSLGAINAIELIACVKAINDSFIPPTLNYTPAEDCYLDYVPNIGRQKNINYVLSTASSFAGIHSVIILKKYTI